MFQVSVIQTERGAMARRANLRPLGSRALARLSRVVRTRMTLVVAPSSWRE